MTRWTAALLAIVMAIGCGDATDPGARCPAGDAPITLGVGAYTVVDPATDAGCVVIAANMSGDSAEYLLIPQSAAGTPGLSNGFTLSGDFAAALAPGFSPRIGHEPTAAERLHDFLRRTEHRSGAAPAAPAHSFSVPPVVGTQRLFSVCAAIDCSHFDQVTATALVVQGHIAVYVDTTTPSPGLTQADLDSVANTFNQRLYPLDTTAFGRESDIDSNQVVIVLFTPTVNRMISAVECVTNGFVAGFFYGADIDPGSASDARFNHGEVFYALVPDESGALSCPHTATAVRNLVPMTFIHEFQHMISFNQHVLAPGGSGQAEAIWLNEGLSHFAEELGARSFLPDDPATYSRFVIGDLSHAYAYLNAPGGHFLVAPASYGTLAERGAAWLFVRYVADQFRADTSFAATAAFTRTLEATPLTGAANLAAHTGVAFDQLVARWAMANWVSDLPGFTAAPELEYRSWSLRAVFASLHAQNAGLYPKAYPLTPTASPGDAVSLSGTLWAGSGVYHRILQGPRAPSVRLLFRDDAGAPLPAAIVPRLSILRIR
jgi:hypothetical protein